MNKTIKIIMSFAIVIVLVAVATYFINNNKVNNMIDAAKNGAQANNALQEKQLEPIKPAEVGDLVVVHYTGTLENGTKFDSSYDRGEPFVFIIGRGMVIKGWDEGLLGAQRGDKKHLVVTSDKGYGDQEIKGADGKVLIPKNATLVFDLEVVEIVAKEKVDVMIKQQEAAQAAQIEASMKK